MSRTAAPLDCPADMEQELIRLSKSRTDEARLVERAKIVLECLAGKRIDQIAVDLGIRAATVGMWRKRFAAQGLAGLADLPRSGKPPTYPANMKQRILKQLETKPPAGLAAWDGGTWRTRSAYRTMRYGAYCVKRAFNCGVTARGVSAPIRSLHRSPPILSACTLTHRKMRWLSASMKNPLFKHWNARRATSRPAAARSCGACRALINDMARLTCLPHSMWLPE